MNAITAFANRPALGLTSMPSHFLSKLLLALEIIFLKPLDINKTLRFLYVKG
jgi:hypothetical protein